MKIAKMLNYWRKIHDVSTREVAKEIGVSNATISRIENGKNIDGQSMVKLLVWLFGIERGE